MASTRWVCGLVAAMVMTAAKGASAEPLEPGWVALKDHAVVVERQDGSLVAGKLVGVEEGSVEVLKPDGSRAVIERSAVKALRTRLRDAQVTVTRKEGEEAISGKLVESDAKTIVVETDDGRRVTVERATINTVRERLPKEPAAAPRAASGTTVGGVSATTDTSSATRPYNGTALLVWGGAFLGVGLGTMSAAAMCNSDSVGDSRAQSICSDVRLGVGGVTAGLGLLLLIPGMVQRSTFNDWQRQHGALGFVSARGGGTLTWKRTF